MHSLVLADVKDRNDVSVVKPGSRPRLLAKALQSARVGPERKRQQFQGDTSSERSLLGLVDEAHAATADLAQDSIIANLRRRLAVGGHLVVSFAGFAVGLSGRLEHHQ